MNRFQSWALAATLALAGCAGQAPNYTGQNASVLPPMETNTPASQPEAAGTGKTSGPVALLLPLTGNLAPAGQALENAAKLAFAGSGAPALDVRDTGGTPEGAAAAAQAAIAAGDGIILGPLTSAEVHAVTPIAQAAQVNVLAFTNDGAAAAPGVWTLGITPAEQVQRVVQDASDGGRTQVAALLPDNDLGHSFATALSVETASLGEPAAQVTFYPEGDFSGLSDAIKQMSDFADRGQSIEDKIKAAQDLNTEAGREQARELQHQQIPPPPFNALFIGVAGYKDSDKNTLDEIANFLPYYYVSQPQVQFLGPAGWAAIAPALAQESVFNGSLYAAPDPATAAAFDAKYQSTYGGPPPAIADVAFDAAAIARLAAAGGGYTTTVLTDPSGFAGTDGVLRLDANGQVQRGLAVFQVAPGAPVVASPAPSTLPTPPSS